METFSLLRVLVVLCATTASLLAREPTSQDYDVWNAIVSHRNGSGATYVWHLVEPTSVFDRGQTKFALDFFPEARPVKKEWAAPAAELDLNKFAFAQTRTNQRSPFVAVIQLLDEAKLAKATGKSPRPIWLVSPKLIPGADAIYRLSWPAYREDGRVAFLICAVCTQWWGAIIEYEVNKDPFSGHWHQGRTARRDITHWENGELFNDE